MIIDIDEHDVKSILPDYNVDFELPKYEFGLTGDFDMKRIIRLLKAINADSIFEFGTWFGRTTKILSLYVDNVWTVDIARENVNLNTLPEVQIKELISVNEIGSCYKDSPNVDGIRQLYGDTSSIGVIRAIRSSFVGGVDASFVDAGHNYCNVLCDSITAISITRLNGLLIWHDVKNGNLELGVDAVLDTLPFNVYHINHSWVGFAINDQDSQRSVSRQYRR